MVWCYLIRFIEFQRLENSIRPILHPKSRNLRNLVLLLISSNDHSSPLICGHASRTTRSKLKQTVVFKLRSIRKLKKIIVFSGYKSGITSSLFLFFPTIFFITDAALHRRSEHYCPHCRRNRDSQNQKYLEIAIERDFQS